MGLGGQIENLLVQNNSFRSADLKASNSVIYGAAGDYKNIKIANNVFSETRPPSQNSLIFVGTRPLFSGNSYSILSGARYSSVVAAGKVVMPVYELFPIHAASSLVTAALNTDQYADGQIIKITGGGPSARVVFAAGGQNGYAVPATRTFTGTQTMELRYNAAAKIWNEISFSETGVTAAR